MKKNNDLASTTPVATLDQNPSEVIAEFPRSTPRQAFLEGLYLDPRLHTCGKHTRLIKGRMTTLSCSRSWFCPYCFEKQMGPKRQKLKASMLTWAQAGGEHALITLAVPHGRLSPLAPLIEEVTQWRERLFSRDKRQAKKWEVEPSRLSYRLHVCDIAGWDASFVA